MTEAQRADDVSLASFKTFFSELVCGMLLKQVHLTEIVHSPPLIYILELS